MPSRKDACECGQLKDGRSRQCRACFSAEPSAKECNGCGQTFPIEQYSLRPNGRGGHKRRSRCKACEAQSAREHRRRNPEQTRKAKQAYNKSHPDKVRYWGNRSAWRRMGLDPDQIGQLQREHDGCCGVCERHEDEVGTLHVDHCHDTEEFRGFLCSTCNTGLGQFQDDVARLRAAIRYLARRKG